MLVILDSLVEPRKYEIQIDKHTGVPYCKIIFCNLSNNNVISLEYTLICHDSFGEPVGDPPNNRITSYIQDINIEPKYFFSNKYPISLKDHLRTRAVEIIVDRVMFSNSEIWSKGKYVAIDIRTKKLAGSDLFNLKEVAGEDAICYAREDKNYWQCVCGRANLLEADKCIRCERLHEIILSLASNKDDIINELQKRDEQRREKERKINGHKEIERKNKKVAGSAKASLIFGFISIGSLLIMTLILLLQIPIFGILGVVIARVLSWAVILITIVSSILGILFGIKGLRTNSKMQSIIGLTLSVIVISLSLIILSIVVAIYS